MPAPLISVVMPVRDGERYLDEALASIRAQTLRDLEIVVVDDGSRDGTAGILHRHAAEEPRLKIVAQPPSGVAAALNRGIAESSAPLIARMDADDISKPHRLAAQYGALLGHPRVAVLGSAYEVIDRTGKIHRQAQPPQLPDDISRILKTSNCIAHPTVLMRREAVVSVGGYRRAFPACEDYDLWLRLDEKADLLNLSDALLLYREHAAQETRRDIEQRSLSELAARLSAGFRRDGLVDPVGANDGPITRRRLEDLGVPARQISDYVVARAIDVASEASASANPRTAWAALRLARHQRRLTLREVARFCRLTGRKFGARLTQHAR